MAVKLPLSCSFDFAGRCDALDTPLRYSCSFTRLLCARHRRCVLVEGHPVEWAAEMNSSETTDLALADRKRAQRLEIARRLYQALVAQDPDRVIILCDCGGRVL